MTLKNESVNGEVQEVYGKIVNSKTVAEDALKLEDFIPARRNVVVEPLPPDTEIGGIILPTEAQADKSVGFVVAVNPEDPDYIVGDLVYYRFGSGQQIRIQGRDVVVLQYFADSFGDILGFWPKDKVSLPEKKSD